MNKRFAIIAGILIIGGILALQGVLYLASLHKVTINLIRPGLTVEVDNVDNNQTKKVAEVKNTTQLSLPKGNYAAIATGANVSSVPTAFIVTDHDISVDINPNLSDAYLAELLKTEQPAINAAIVAAYPQVPAGFKLKTGKLYREGNWYSTTLLQNPPHPKSNGDLYRIVVHKEDGQWKTATAPKIVLSSKDYPDVPDDIIRSANLPN